MKLSVLMLTYNHERFIAQAVESVLAQQVDFDFEVVIGDDCSTDRTRQILATYEQRYPGKIHLVLPGKNCGPAKNFMQTFSACAGEYVAILDGDDFWLSRGKLQRQVDVLDNNPQFSLCFTNSTVVDENGGFLKDERIPVEWKKNLTQEEIVFNYCPPTNTVVFRRALVGKFPKKFEKIINVDFIIYSIVTGFGDAFFLDDITSAYRVHGGGVWSSRPKEYIIENNLKTRKFLLSFVGEKSKIKLVEIVAWYYTQRICYYEEKHMDVSYIKSYLSFLIYNKIYRNKSTNGYLFGFLCGLMKVLKRRSVGLLCPKSLL